ncbi:hypothetical protein BC834DRAFT_912570, partial [Gloeopeniophorella convolvens]
MQRMFAATDGQFPLLEKLYLRYIDPQHPNDRPLTSSSQARTFVFPSVLSAPRPDLLHPEKTLSLIKPPTLPHLPALRELLLRDIPSAILLPPGLLLEILSTTPLLEDLRIWFRFPDLHRDTGAAAIPRCTSLPRLHTLLFKGAREYCDDLVSQISAPSLEKFHTTFFNRLPLALPNLGSPSHRLWQSLLTKSMDFYVVFDRNSVRTYQGLVRHSAGTPLQWKILSNQFDWQVASVAEVFQALTPALLMVDNLRLQLYSDSMPPGRQDGSEPQDWCNLFRSFSNVETLEVPPTLRRDVSQALMSNGAQASLELLPELQTLELCGGDRDGEKAFGDFLEARARANRPVS